MEIPWRSIPCKILQLRLKVTLSCGQSFQWCQTGENEWTSVLANRVWKLRQEDDQILWYKVFEPKNTHENTNYSTAKAKTVKKEDRTCLKIKKSHTDNATVKTETDDEATLRNYFQLDVDLEDLYKKWCKADGNFKAIASDFAGVRIMRQDPVENLFSFICSSNNNISRITGMVQRLCEKYGDFLMEVEGVRYYRFPTIQALAEPQVEQELRDLGFGYRAKFISQSAQYIIKHHDQDWLFSLKKVSYEEAHKALCKLPGVGAKVADCVCLMSLDKTQAIPVDTHVWQIAARFYLPDLNKTKSLTDKLYKQIGDHFRLLFGSYAGWAHSVLFSADLKKFQDLISHKPTLTKRVKLKQDGIETEPSQSEKQEAKRQTTSIEKKVKNKKRKGT